MLGSVSCLYGTFMRLSDGSASVLRKSLLQEMIGSNPRTFENPKYFVFDS